MTDLKTDAPRLLHGVPRIAAFLGCRPKRVYRLLERRADKASRLPLWKIAGMWVAEEDDLLRWIKLQRRKAGGWPVD